MTGTCQPSRANATAADTTTTSPTRNIGRERRGSCGKSEVITQGRRTRSRGATAYALRRSLPLARPADRRAPQEGQNFPSGTSLSHAGQEVLDTT